MRGPNLMLPLIAVLPVDYVDPLMIAMGGTGSGKATARPCASQRCYSGRPPRVPGGKGVS